MEAKDWSQIKKILEAAIEQPNELRADFVAEKCAHDHSLHQQINSLLESYSHVDDFMEDGAIANVAEIIVSSKGDLYPGDRLNGRYKVVRTIGQGGMGKVYLADDLDLHRQVAVKVLRDDLWRYKEARLRLLREARSAARLDHPNICTTYEVDDSDERSFIVMQYVQGETLGDILSSRKPTIRWTVEMVIQIADALEAAHASHIIHRDIKPANIIITGNGQVKVLDFGLAKSIEGNNSENDISSSGEIIGTVPYMSPEQLRGRSIDGRSDIFSLGSLLYEMLTGVQAFGRENNAETISAILNEEPDLSLLPDALNPIVDRALVKDVVLRYETVSELSLRLRNLSASALDENNRKKNGSRWFGASTNFRRFLSTGDSRTSIRSHLSWPDHAGRSGSKPSTATLKSTETGRTYAAGNGLRFVAVLSVIIAAIVAGTLATFWHFAKTADPHSFDSLRPVRLTSWKVAASGVASDAEASHSGNMIAYSSSKQGPNEAIFIRQILESSDIQVTKDDWNNYSPVWSPDDQRIAYVSVRNSVLGIYVQPFLGGPSTLINTVEKGVISLRHWARDGKTIFYEYNGNLFSLNVDSRSSSQITNFTTDINADRQFSFSPDEASVVYADSSDNQTDLWVADLALWEPRRLTSDKDVESRPRWDPDGKRIVYSVVRDGQTHIDVGYLDGTRSEQMTRGEGQQQLIDISSDGNKIFYLSWETRSDIWRTDTQTSVEEPVASEKELEFWPEISPDGASLAYQVNFGFNPEESMFASTIVVKDLQDGTHRKAPGFDPHWLSDGRHVAFLRREDGQAGNSLWTLDIASGEEKQVADGGVRFSGFGTLPYNRNEPIEFDFSADGEIAAYARRSNARSNVQLSSVGKIATLTSNSDSKTSFHSTIWDADGHRLAFVSQTMSDDATPMSSALWLFDHDKVQQLFASEGDIHFLGWSPDGKLICESAPGMFSAVPMSVSLFSLSLQGEKRQLSDLEDVYADSFRLLKTGLKVVYVSRSKDKDDLSVFSIQTRDSKRITNNSDPRVFYGSPVWSPDGKDVYFDKQERISTISMFENFK